MAIEWSVEQVLALAPDASAAKAGQGLAHPGKWVTCGCDEEAVWGECAGSAKLPYQTQIDLNGPAFKCSCPSRKFPCKHGLGLLLLLATKPAIFMRAARPAWVADWFAARAKREEKKAAASEATEQRAPDPKAQAKRAAQRQTKVQHGLEELELWLCDIVRQGLASVQSQPTKFWEHMAARMVDAQASGVARLLRNLGAVAGTASHERLLERLGQLHLLIDRYKRIDTLPELAQTDLRTLIGWTQNQEVLLAGDGVADRWRVVGQRVEWDNRLRVQRNWLWGAQTGRAALLLQYAHGKGTFGALVAPGMTLDAELVFYPGSYPLRALIKSQRPIGSMAPLTGHAAITEAYKAYAGTVSKYPWIEQFPMLLNEQVPVRRGERWSLRDTQGCLIPLADGFEYDWALASFSGGRPVSVFGEWDGEALLPLSASTADRFVAMSAIVEV